MNYTTEQSLSSYLLFKRDVEKKENYCEFRQNSKNHLNLVNLTWNWTLVSYFWPSPLIDNIIIISAIIITIFITIINIKSCILLYPLTDLSFLSNLYLRKRDWYGDHSEAGKIWENKFSAMKTVQHTPSRPAIDDHTCQGFSRTFQIFFRPLSWPWRVAFQEWDGWRGGWAKKSTGNGFLSKLKTMSTVSAVYSAVVRPSLIVFFSRLSI